MARDGEVSDPSLLLPEIALAEEGFGEGVLDLPVNVVDKDVGLALLLVPGNQASRVDGAHPARRPFEVAGGCIHHDHIPLNVVNLARKAFVCQLALGEPGVAHLLALILLHSNLDEIVRLVDLGVIGHVVRLQAGNPLLDLVDPGLVLLQEHGAPAVVEGRPHEAVVAQAEHEEVAG
ncbi:uncharacterized protein DS421_19g634990 [Arachis hypogaea]|uniref:Uncharacterized protein n=1 Tax=Arachis hypogaea TaxID=3818 RepID=A0A6B9V4K6_ARAHY|nr:uncharacterized protein DS421_19g634990 [Arachis hypogaea]